MIIDFRQTRIECFQVRRPFRRVRGKNSGSQLPRLTGNIEIIQYRCSDIQICNHSGPPCGSRGQQSRRQAGPRCDHRRQAVVLRQIAGRSQRGHEQDQIPGKIQTVRETADKGIAFFNRCFLVLFIHRIGCFLPEVLRPGGIPQLYGNDVGIAPYLLNLVIQKLIICTDPKGPFVVFHEKASVHRSSWNDSLIVHEKRCQIAMIFIGSITVSDGSGMITGVPQCGTESTNGYGIGFLRIVADRLCIAQINHSFRRRIPPRYLLIKGSDRYTLIILPCIKGKGGFGRTDDPGSCTHGDIGVPLGSVPAGIGGHQSDSAVLYQMIDMGGVCLV